MHVFTELIDEFTSYLTGLRKECNGVNRRHQSIVKRIGFVQEKIQQGAFEKISAYFEKVWELVCNFDKNSDDYTARQQYIQEKLHPFICAGGLNNMVFDKPFGYAGDHLTIYHYFLDYSGEHTYEIFINQYSRSIPVARAHQNRIPLLMREIQLHTGKNSKIMSIGCGPAIEVQRLSAEPGFQDREFVLCDFSSDSLDFVRRNLPGLTPNVAYLHTNLLSLLKTLQTKEPTTAGKDFIYCCGLFDYLTDRMADRLLAAMYKNLKPGGRLLVTNVNSQVSHRGYFEFFADWNLVLRSSAELLALGERFTPEAERWLKSCPEAAANDYLYLQRPL